MYRVRVNFSGISGSPYVATHYFEILGGTAQQAATAVGTFWGAVDNVLSNNLQWDLDTAVYSIDAATGQPFDVVQVTPASGTGGVAGDILSPASQGLISWRTGVFTNGRELRGRTFLPAIPEAQSTGAPIAGFITAVSTAAGAFIADANSDLQVYSRKHGVHASAVGGGVWNEWAVLRSRRD